MSVYFVKGKGWRWDLLHKGTRHTEAWFPTKKEARQALQKRKETILNPQQTQVCKQMIQTDMVFVDLVNLRLDHVKDYNSDSHYQSYLYLARKWVKQWGNLMCSEITPVMIQQYLSQRRKVSAYTANKDLRNLRATFNYGIRKKIITENPTAPLDFFPVEKKIKYVPSNDDINKVIAAADPDTRDYLWAIRETMARVSEINQLSWDDVDLKGRYLFLYTRKKRGGHLTPRKIPMTGKLYEILQRRYVNRDPDKPWVFWHRYWSRKHGQFMEGPYDDRKKLMKGLCNKAGVRYFRFHPIRHSGASIMDSNNVPIGAIQRILGHENRKTTEIYLHSMGDLERQAMDAFERARENSHTDSHTESHTNEKKVIRLYG